MRKVLPFIAVCLLCVAGTTFVSNGPASHQAAGSITFVNNGAKGISGTGNVTCPAPSSPQVDDIWIAAIMTTGSGSVTMSSEWTPISNQASPSLYLFWHRYNGVDPSRLATITGSQTPIGSIASFRGCKRTGDPVNVVGSASSGSDASIEITGVTPTVANCMLVAVDCSQNDNIRSPIPSGFTATFEDSTGGTDNCWYNTLDTPNSSLALYYKTHITGATGDFSATQAASNAWSSRLIALQPE